MITQHAAFPPFYTFTFPPDYTAALMSASGYSTPAVAATAAVARRRCGPPMMDAGAAGPKDVATAYDAAAPDLPDYRIQAHQSIGCSERQDIKDTTIHSSFYRHTC